MPTADVLQKKCNKCNNLLCTINSFESSVFVIAVSEAWLKPGRESLYRPTITNYSFITRSRTNSAGGGVRLYIHNDYAWKQRDDLVLDGPDLECIFVELTDPNVIVGCIYRKPSWHRYKNF